MSNDCTFLASASSLLIFFSIKCKAPKRLKYASVVAKDTPDSNHLISEPPSKKAKTSSSSNAIYHHTLDEVKDAVNWFDSMIRQ